MKCRWIHVLVLLTLFSCKSRASRKNFLEKYQPTPNLSSEAADARGSSQENGAIDAALVEDIKKFGLIVITNSPQDGNSEDGLGLSGFKVFSYADVKSKPTVEDFNSIKNTEVNKMGDIYEFHDAGRVAEAKIVNDEIRKGSRVELLNGVKTTPYSVENFQNLKPAEAEIDGHFVYLDGDLRDLPSGQGWKGWILAPQEIPGLFRVQRLSTNEEATPVSYLTDIKNGTHREAIKRWEGYRVSAIIQGDGNLKYRLDKRLLGRSMKDEISEVKELLRDDSSSPDSTLLEERLGRLYLQHESIFNLFSKFAAGENERYKEAQLRVSTYDGRLPYTLLDKFITGLEKPTQKSPLLGVGDPLQLLLEGLLWLRLKELKVANRPKTAGTRGGRTTQATGKEYSNDLSLLTKPADLEIFRRFIDLGLNTLNLKNIPKSPAKP